MSDQKEPPKTSNPLMKSLFIWIGILVVIMLAVNMFASASRTAAQSTISYSDFLTKVDSDQVRSVQIAGPNITGKTTDDAAFKTYAPQRSHAGRQAEGQGCQVFSAAPRGAEQRLDAAALSGRCRSW